ncbi:NADH-quinone oxidoreductase subunit M [Marinicella gelatinilytica]|uniref:NADH-quinone oxidoreductase subunit M n=1 Tax=Marinicella gelatinilytica TaxID=2996017 RepID=UPI002260A59B|nr:NADH-quinone oxidoreductase subunit M [Marinicella gelatinilytica]MCX7544794.1 NADH-quinone oxidoreductase subunit M [Marinicella gelatinilytica]
MFEQSLLSLLIWLPIIGGLLVLALGQQRAGMVKLLTFALAMATFLLSLPLWIQFDGSSASMQFVENLVWIGALDIHYHIGVNGISMPLVILTTLITVLIILSAWRVIDKHVHQYMAAMLILEGLLIGVFVAHDALLFYLFFEAMLIPMFIIIGVWGGPNRVYATIKFFLYTFLGSVLMLIGLIYLYMKGGTWNLTELAALPLSLQEQTWLFFAFLAAFAVKIPMFPVHTWLPDAHVEAPTGGSVILAAIMLKVGGYGFIRLSLPILPDASLEYAWLLITLSLIAIIYIGLVAIVQKDMKKLIAYSSISHMGFVTLGIFLVFLLMKVDGNSEMALTGAVVQMISHGFISAAMFLCVGVLYDRLHTRMIRDYGGVLSTMPWFGGFFVFFAMANSGLPGTSGFVGEFMVILASFKANFWIAFSAALTLILGASYSLWMVKRVVFGPITNEAVESLQDVSSREFFILAVLAILVLVLGVWPEPLVDVMRVSVQQVIEHVSVSKVI